MLHRGRLLLVLVLLCAVGCGRRQEDGPVLLRVTLTHGNNSRPYMPLPREVAKQIKGALAPAGIDVTIDQMEWGPYLDYVQNGEHQMALLGWSADIPDPDNFLYVLLDKDNARLGSANNISFYTSEEVHRLLLEARRIDDPARRRELYRKAQEIIFRDVPMVPLVYTERMIAHRAGFGPLRVQPIMQPLLRRVKTPKDGTLVYLRGSDSVSLDPGDVTDGESSKVLEQVFDTLLRFKPGSTDVEPSLARSWKASDDRRTWTFDLREGVRFHDGTPVDGAAAANAFQRQYDPQNPSHFADGTWTYWQDLFGFVERVEAGPGPLQVTFRCKRAAPPFFLKMLAAFNTGIPSPAGLARYGADFRRHPVGSGPFRFVSWISGQEIHLQRNPAYWDGAPALKDVFFRVSENATVRSTRLLAGEQADLIDNIDPDTVPDLEASKQVVVERMPGLNFGYLAMNTHKPPFDDVRVRRAVALALSKARIVKFAYQGLAQPATTPVPPTIDGHDDAIVDRKRDVAAARALLREALGSK
jgi:ABC-type transport system substrate-binding protein